MKSFFKYLLIIATTIASTLGILHLAIELYPRLEIYHPQEVVYKDINESIFLSTQFNNNGDYTPLDKIPEYFINAILLMEDQRFYSHHGIDYKGIIRSIFTNIKEGEIKQGGSTLTQQLARSLYLTNEKTLSRKIKEALIAKKLESQFSKEQILELYLNTIYFGHNIYGINQASYYYFNKLPPELTLAESSLLAGIIASPNNYAPDIDYEKSINRQKLVLKILNSHGYITNIEKNEAEQEQLVFNFTNKILNKNSHMYYLNYITKLLQNKQILTKESSNIGYSIDTYLDTNILDIVTNAISTSIYDSFEEEVAVVIMKPYSGKVLCLVGGKNYLQSELDRATSSYFQIGSTIKPILYYLGMCFGMTPLSTFKSEKTDFYIKDIGLYSPKNSNDKYANRNITMLEALSLSDNIYAIKTTLLLGSHTIASFLNRFGIDVENENPTIGLGSVSLSPLQLCSIYNAFASEGAYYPPVFYSKITLSNNDLLINNKETPSFYLNKQIVNVLSYLLLSPFDEGLVSYTSPSLINYQTNVRFGAKTGSTSYCSWVVGYNPNYTICVWTGNDKNNENKNSNLSKVIFQKIANNLTYNSGDIYFKIPTNSKPFSLSNKETGRTSNVYYTI